MAVNYAVPSWVKGADPIGKRLQAYSIGLQAAQAAARLAIERQHLQHQANQMAQDAQLAQMRLQIAQQEQQRKEAHDAQQIEVLKEYHRQQGDLKQLQLADQEKKLQWESNAAAQKATAIMRMQARIAAGEDPTQVALEEGPALGPIFSNALRVSRMPKAIIPGEPVKAGTYIDPNTNLPIKGWVNVPTASGRGTHPMKVPTGDLSPEEARHLLDVTQFSDNPEDKKIADAARKVLSKSAGLQAPALDSPLPYPKSEADAIDQQAYVTKNGVAKWNASSKKMIPVAVAAPESELPDYAQLPGEGAEGDSASPESAPPPAEEEPNLFDEQE